ncbi:protein rogdi-like isoform X1 [Ornithodoros turicata]|uniref:protein rogdi-like isoform X1 n=1 Tax=Ornithodoros turicata TaxID=34597 RepID=UPI003139E260
MSDADLEEITALKEFEWLLHEEVNVTLEQLQSIILECSKRFPLSFPGVENTVKSEKFVMTGSSSSTPDQIKVVVTLAADNVSHADINLRIPKHSMPNHRTIVQNDCQWKLQQVQDAGNHLIQALNLLTPCSTTGHFEFQSAEEVTQMMNTVMGCLQRGRACLIIPKKRTIDEIMKSRNMKSLQPPLPNDVAVSFYVQSHKLIFAVYHIQKDSHGQVKFDVFQAETSIPWLSEVLVLFTVALQLCQQLKDKIGVFSQYKDFHMP